MPYREAFKQHIYTGIDSLGYILYLHKTTKEYGASFMLCKVHKTSTN